MDFLKFIHMYPLLIALFSLLVLGGFLLYNSLKG